jgi:hypothetical protein
MRSCPPDTITPARVRPTRAHRARVLAALAVICAAGLIVVGCGSSKSSTSSASSKPTIAKAQLIAEGNAICAQGNKQLLALRTALEKSLTSAPSEARLTSYVNSSYAPLIEGQINQLKALGAPPREEAKLAHMFAVAQEELDVLKSNPLLLLGSRFPFEAFAKLAHPYGLTACATSG